MQLTTGFFWTAPRRGQVGLDPRVGVSLDGLEPVELRLVDSLTRPQSEMEVEARAKAGGIETRRLRSILAMLEQAGVLDMEPSSAPDAMARRRIFGSDAAGALAGTQRAHRHIHLHTADYLGAGIALGLAQCGFGKITTNDAATITFYDHPSMRRMGVGYGRDDALKTLLRQANPHVTTGRRTSSAPDLVVVTGSYATDPVTVGQYVSEGVPVYQAWVEEVDVFAGPLTIAHETPCANCLMLHRADVDPNWRRIAPQACAAPPLQPDMSAAMVAIGLAVRDIAGTLDEGRVADMWRVSPAPMPPQQMVLLPHPKCGCTRFATLDAPSASSGELPCT